jgi:hypothetical protein
MGVGDGTRADRRAKWLPQDRLKVVSRDVARLADMPGDVLARDVGNTSPSSDAGMTSPWGDRIGRRRIVLMMCPAASAR